MHNAYAATQVGLQSYYISQVRGEIVRLFNNSGLNVYVTCTDIRITEQEFFIRVFVNHGDALNATGFNPRYSDFMTAAQILSNATKEPPGAPRSDKISLFMDSNRPDINALFGSYYEFADDWIQLFATIT